MSPLDLLDCVRTQIQIHKTNTQVQHISTPLHQTLISSFEWPINLRCCPSHNFGLFMDFVILFICPCPCHEILVIQSGTGNFSFFWWYRKKNWYRKKVSEPVSEKVGTGKKYRNRYQKNLVPELIFFAKI